MRANREPRKLVADIREPLCFQHLSVKDLREIGNSSKSKHLVDYFGIAISDIINLPENLLLLFTHAINRLIDSGYIPLTLLTIPIRPTKKVDAPKSLCDFRPISLIPSAIKILEKWMYNQISENKVKGPHTQHGFRTGKSCETNQLELLEHVVKNEKNGFDTLTILLDLSKAFDTLFILSISNMIPIFMKNDKAKKKF